MEGYTEWIQAVADFTVTSLNSWQWAQGSVFYLLGLWSRLVSSMPYLKGASPSLLEANVPTITRAYITSRLQSVPAALEAGALDELLEGEEALAEQLEALPYLCRFQYEAVAAFLCSLLDPLLEQFRAAAHQPAPPDALSVIEGQLSWLAYIVGAVVRGRLTSSSAEAQELTDGELSARVFGLARAADEGLHARRYGEATRRRLDAALLAFFQSFRKVYIGEQVMHASKVYGPLGEQQVRALCYVES